MARRSSLLNDLMGLAAHMPWPVGLGLAIASFAVLHLIGAGFGHHQTAPTNIAALGGTIEHDLLVDFAFLAQFVIPPALLIGTTVSFFRRRLGDRALARATAGGAAAIATTSPTEFELMVGSALRASGFTVTNQTLPGPDGGVDLVVSKDGKKFLVQCKHWQSKSVGVEIIREIKGVVATRGAGGGIVVTSSRFTNDAREFAGRSGILLIDGRDLERLIGDSAKGPKTYPQAHVGSPTGQANSDAAPTCPTCGGPMTIRTARQGKFAGKDFWACRGYPKCRGIVDISASRS